VIMVEFTIYIRVTLHYIFQVQVCSTVVIYEVRTLFILVVFWCQTCVPRRVRHVSYTDTTLTLVITLNVIFSNY